MLLVSPDLRILFGNPAVEEMFGRARASFQGHPLSELLSEAPAVHQKIRHCIDTGTSHRDVECRAFRKPNGSSFPVSLTLSPYLTPDGHAQGAVVLIKDLSLLKELQETSRQLDRLASIGAISVGMAHEIRNPLMGIRGSAQLLLQDLKTPQQREFLEVVIGEVDRINRMVDRMLDFSRPRKLALGITNIHKVLEDIVVLEREALNRKHCRVEQIYDPSLPPIEADEDQLRQVFLNLIKNGIQATPEHGTVKLITRFSTAYTVKTTDDPLPRPQIIIEVVDSGPGMDEETKTHLFTPFFTTKKKGSGLGLSISLNIIEMHGGKMKIETEKGRGTAVQVFLPIHQR